MSSLKRQRVEEESASPSSLNANGSAGNGTKSNTEPRIPKVSRKIHACTECQARKIKCDIEPPHKKVCSRCQKKKLKCVVNKSLQSLLEEDTQWKTSLEQNTQALSLAVTQILGVLNLPDLDAFTLQVQQSNALHELANSDAHVSPADEKHEPHSILSAPPAMAMTRENSQDPELARRHDAPLVTDPMGALYEVTKLRNLRANSFGRSQRPHPTSILENDFITKGIVTLAQGEEMFRVFSTSLNHFLWGGVALVHDTLASARRSSSLLAAAIICVTALHIPGNEKLFETAYGLFTNLVCETMFARYHNLDEIRALAIGAFWLSDVSWNLSGHAVRIATELNLHQNYSRAMRGSREHLEGAKLWYFLYVCDHHFSIAYGRPPVIQEDMTITNHEKFLELAGINQGDVRLHSQVAVFIILTRVYNTFGPDIEEMILEADLMRLQHFNSALDMWRSNWIHRLAPNMYVATYPAKGVDLHLYFGKLQVSSLSLRGIQKGMIYELSPQRRDLANTAINCATAILQMALNDSDVRNSLVGVPIYLHTMIAYSAVFLLKARQRSDTYQLTADPILILDLVNRIINLLLDARAGERHLSGHIATGLKKMMDRMISRETSQKPGETQLHESTPDYLHNPDGQMWGGPNYFGIPDNGVLRMFDESALFSNENFFPLGFFDAMPATHADMDYRPRDV